jgi:S-disulfanyl-L-cysteine oxidoreductase SoxD
MMRGSKLRNRGTLAMGAAALVLGGAIAHAQGADRTVWTGVYTADQAAHGKEAYGQNCASCHGPSLAGIDVAPPLTGNAFLANWNNTSAGDLFDRIHTTMPLNNPGSLPGKTVADIEAYIFQVNGFPAGEVALPPSQPMMANVKILATKPAS